MRSSRCLLSIALLGCFSAAYAQNYEVADFGERMPTNGELVEALIPGSSVGIRDIAIHDDAKSRVGEKAKIVLHGGAEPQIPSPDISAEPRIQSPDRPREPRRMAMRDDEDLPSSSRDLPQTRQQQGRQKAISLQVQFDYNSTELTPASKAKLSVVASALNSAKLANYKFRIEGHTDSVGSAQYNLKLSERRAQSVARCLIGQYQIEPSRLRAIGKGMSKPANPANPRAPENRRVMIVNEGQS